MEGSSSHTPVMWSTKSNCPPDKAEGASLQALLYKQHMPNKSVLITSFCMNANMLLMQNGWRTA